MQFTVRPPRFCTVLIVAATLAAGASAQESERVAYGYT